MKDILQDIAHTHALGFPSPVKVNNEEGTAIDPTAEDLQCYFIKGQAHPK